MITNFQFYGKRKIIDDPGPCSYSEPGDDPLPDVFGAHQCAMGGLLAKEDPIEADHEGA